MGIVAVYPVAYLFKWIIFKIIESPTSAVWSPWVFAPLILFAFTAIVTLILRRKIVKIDMNESLKAIE